MKPASDTAKFVGLPCETCGHRVYMSGEKATSAFWSTDPKTGAVKAWHLTDSCYFGKAAA